ncbi:MAG: M90 family metallopeptidase [Planctomycetota bacterium]
MFLHWMKDRRRQQLLHEPFPETWLAILEKNVSHYRLLNEEEKKRLRDDLRIFVAEKNWEGCGGLEMTDEIRVTIGALACLLNLAILHDHYKQVLSVLVYPTGYVAPQQTFIREGVVAEGASGRLGEAWYRGPVVLSWQDAKLGGKHQQGGHNVVIHEFAHEHDMLNRGIDGVPPMRDKQQYERWESVMQPEYENLVRHVEMGFPTFIDPYGATNRAEFFAVTTECFFEEPLELERRHPALYRELSGYYNQDPASRIRAAQSRSRRVP